MKRILLVDDHQIFREALRGLLERMPELEVVGETGDGLAVFALVNELQPDIVCMDIGIPGRNGIEVTRQLMAAFPALKVIALSTYSDQIYVIDMIKAGAAAYVTKAEGGKELLRAIEAVSNGQHYFCPGVADVVTRALVSPKEQQKRALLGAREQQVLCLVAEGLSSQTIAARLGIATGTVDVHRRNILRKLGLHSAVDLTRYAISIGLVSG
jgi:DNA-binding NarL/FixJ family response regulator